MRKGRLATLACTAAITAVASIAATTSTAATPTLIHRLSMTTSGGTARAESSTAGGAPWLRLPTRSRVWFTVPRKTFPSVFFASLPPAAGRYLAFYLRELAQGTALVPDPGSVRHWPAVLQFGAGFGFSELVPGRVYSMDIALDRAARVQMPFAMHVVRQRTEKFAVAFDAHPVALPAPVTPAVTGSTPDSLGRLPLSTTAVAIDWKTDPSSVSETSGDACPSTTQSMSCTGSANMTYDVETWEFGTVGGPHQLVMGEAFDTPADAAYISAYATSVPTPFDAATIYGFAMAPPGPLRV
jgi:hypothetical protein